MCQTDDRNSSFCSTLGATVSLPSRYHPRSKCQAVKGIRIWRRLFVVWVHKTPLTGQLIWFVLDIHTIPILPLPLVFLLSRPPSGTCYLCHRKLIWRCPRSSTISNSADATAVRPGLLSFGPKRAIAGWQIDTELWCPHINPDKRFGSRHVYLLLDSSVRMSSTRSQSSLLAC